MSNNIELTRMKLPEYGLPDEAPELSPEIYRKRLSAFIRRSQAAGYQVMAVYGDREHFSNLRYLTGYDPRFEEALLLLDLTTVTVVVMVVVVVVNLDLHHFDDMSQTLLVLLL